MLPRWVFVTREETTSKKEGSVQSQLVVVSGFRQQDVSLTSSSRSGNQPTKHLPHRELVVYKDSQSITQLDRIAYGEYDFGMSISNFHSLLPPAQLKLCPSSSTSTQDNSLDHSANQSFPVTSEPLSLINPL
jgi:hypothetical protein